MPVFLFVIGVVLFLGFGFFIVLWILGGMPEDYFYRSFGCLLGMAILSICFNIWGNYVFTIQAQKWILFSISTFLLLFIIFYFWGYIFLCFNEFEPRLLLMCLPALIEIFFIVGTFVEFDLITLLSNIFRLFTLPFAFVIINIILLAISIILRLKLKESNSKVNFFEKYIHNNSDINFSDFNIINCSQSDRAKLEHVIMELYTFSQNNHLSPSNVSEILKRFDIPQFFLNRITERIFGTNLYLKASSISMLEFAQEVLPEYYRSRKPVENRNSSMDIRMFEDLYDRFRHLFYDEQRELASITNKIEELSQIVRHEAKVDIPNTEYCVTDDKSCQNQIRELFHALEAPIATTEMALSNLQASIPEIRSDQLKKFEKIQNNLKIIKTVLYAYRELTFMTIRGSDNAFFPLPKAIQSIRDLLECEPDTRISINGFPDEIPYYSTNLITILILPLLQNAMEATPKDKVINVNYIDASDYYIINISNHCSRLPSLTKIQTDGYSSKDNHVGTGISIVKRVSNIIGINFILSIDNNQVIASLQLPKKKKR